MTSKSTSLPSSIEGVTGKHAISELWKSHFGRLLNVIQDDGLCDISCDTVYSDDIHVSTNEVVLAVQALCANKASGIDGIVAEHLLYGQRSQKLYNWPKILSPPHYRNGVHHTDEIICLNCGELRDVSENI